MNAKERILPDWKLIDIAEALYNFRNAMDIEGIKNTLWQLAKQQDNVSFKVGIKEVVGIVRDWETIPSEEFNKKYKVRTIDDVEDETLLEIIVRYLGIGKLSSKQTDMI